MVTANLTEEYERQLAELNQLKQQSRLMKIKTLCFGAGMVGGVYATLFILNRAPQHDHHTKD